MTASEIEKIEQFGERVAVIFDSLGYTDYHLSLEMKVCNYRDRIEWVVYCPQMKVAEQDMGYMSQFQNEDSASFFNRILQRIKSLPSKHDKEVGDAVRLMEQAREKLNDVGEETTADAIGVQIKTIHKNLLPTPIDLEPVKVLEE